MAGIEASLQIPTFNAIAMSNTDDRSVQMEDDLQGLAEATPGSYTYQHLLSRIGGRDAYSQPRPARESNMMPMHEHDYTDVLKLLYRQPLEIQTLTLTYLEAADLLALRFANREAHNLVHVSTSALAASWTERLSKQLKLTHIPLILPNLAEFVRTSQQYPALCQVADILAKRICRHLRLGKRVQGELQSLDKEALEAWRQRKRSRLRARLTRSLLLLQHYLNFLLDTFHENERHLKCLDNEEYMTLSNVFDLDQQAWLNLSMKNLTERDFIDVTATLSIFKATCKARGVDFRYKPPAAHSAISVRQLLVYKGFKPFVELLSRRTSFTEQSVALQRNILNITRDRFRYPSWVPSKVGSIHAMETYHQNVTGFFDTGRSQLARDLFVAHQDIWDRAARSLMMPSLGRFPSIQSSTTWIQKVCVVQGEERESEIVVGAWDAIDVPTV